MSEKNEFYSVFISYAHEDNESSEPNKRWLNRLMEQLEPLIKQNQVRAWSDQEIEAGDNWHEHIQAALQSVKAAVLLVSPAFLASKYIRNSELPILLRRAQVNGVVIIPIILRPSLFKETIFKFPDPSLGPEQFSLASLQSANSPNQPLNKISEYEQDNVLVSVARRLLELVYVLEEPKTELGTASQNAVLYSDSLLPLVERENATTGSRQTRSVSEALYALSQMLDAPKVREAVVAFQTDFEAASCQIDMLSAYKDLHDWLHTLQFQCYERVLAESNRFPEDEMALENLIDHEWTLRYTLASIQLVAGRGQFVQIDTAWMLKGLQDALVELQAAIETLEKRRLYKTAFLLTRVLNVFPSQINTRLNEAAKALRLQSIVEAMKIIWNTLVSLQIDHEKVSQFGKGVKDLSSLHTDLSALLQEHDKWQLADGELRLINPDSDQFIEELDTSWPRLKFLTESLYQVPDNWAIIIKEDSDRLESALTLQSPVRVKVAFRRYRRSASLRFFEVDVKLKMLCSNLRLVGDPLISILKVIE